MGVGVQAGVVHIGIPDHPEPLSNPASGVVVGGGFVTPIRKQVHRMVVKHNVRTFNPNLPESKTFVFYLDGDLTLQECRLDIIKFWIFRRPPFGVQPFPLHFCPERAAGADVQAGLGQCKNSMILVWLAAFFPMVNDRREGDLAVLICMVADLENDREGVFSCRCADGHITDGDFGGLLQPHILPYAGMVAGDQVAGGDQRAPVVGIIIIVNLHHDFVVALVQETGNIRFQRECWVDMGADALSIDKKVGFRHDGVNDEFVPSARFD